MKITFASLILVSIGVATLLVSLYFRYQTKRFIDESIQTYGEVVALHQTYSEGRTLFAPVIRFIRLNGVKQVFIDSVSSSHPIYAIGDQVKIAYHRYNSDEVRIATNTRLYLSSIISGIIGIIFCSIGAAIVIWNVIV